MEAGVRSCGFVSGSTMVRIWEADLMVQRRGKGSFSTQERLVFLCISVYSVLYQTIRIKRSLEHHIKYRLEH